jgi:hypothetical protein
MNEQLNSYETLIQTLIDAVDTTVPLEVGRGNISSQQKASWEGHSNVLTISDGVEGFAIQIFDRNQNLLDAEELTLPSAYAMVGKFIDMEA